MLLGDLIGVSDARFGELRERVCDFLGTVGRRCDLGGSLGLFSTRSSASVDGADIDLGGKGGGGISLT
jgi:hypothetical protein